VVALAAVAGCGGRAEPAVIGYGFEITGTPSVAVARDELAARRSGPGIRVVFDSVASGERPDIEIERAQRLAAEPGLVGVVGHAGSRASLAAAPVYNEAGIPHIVPTGTSRQLRDAGPWTFALAPNDSVEGEFIAEFVTRRLGARRVTIFYTNDEYGEGLRDGVDAGLARLGATVVDRVPFAYPGDLAARIDASLRRGIPDVVVAAMRWRATGRLTRLVTERVPGIRVVAGDGAMVLPRLADSAGPAADALFIVDFWVPDSSRASRAFVERFRRVAGVEPRGSHAMSHDALMLLAHAAREVGPDRGEIRRYLMSLGGSRPPYPGVTGPISFRPDRRPNLVMTRLVSGEPERVEAP